MAVNLARQDNRMPVRHNDRGDLFNTFQQRMNRMFNEFFEDFDWMPEQTREAWTGWAPPIDLTEDENTVFITAELPGIDEKDVNVSLEGDVLTIRGKKADDRGPEKTCYCGERTFGEFERNVELPVPVESDMINATFKNGVLTVALPKSKEKRKQVKKIPIRV